MLPQSWHHEETPTNHLTGASYQDMPDGYVVSMPAPLSPVRGRRMLTPSFPASPRLSAALSPLFASKALPSPSRYASPRQFNMRQHLLSPSDPAPSSTGLPRTPLLFKRALQQLELNDA
jgi:hypothetical protein